MILLRILEHDLHRTKRGLEASPFMIEVPARPNFVPAVISNTRGKFIVSRRLTEDGRVRIGIFEHNPDQLDNTLENLFDAAYALSRDEGWKNIFVGNGANTAKAAFNYIGEQSGMPGIQPHVCLIPESWTPSRIDQFFGAKNHNGRRYGKICHIALAKVTMPVFCSRPDMVGMYTQFMGGKTGILLHNIRSGLAFCAPKGGS